MKSLWPWHSATKIESVFPLKKKHNYWESLEAILGQEVFVCNFKKKHQNKKKTLNDWALFKNLIKTLLGGSSFWIFFKSFICTS